MSLEHKVTGYHFYLEENHSCRPCTLMEWAEQFEYLSCHNKKHVGNDIINGKHVSTVWLGTDHNFLREINGGPPLLFETMVFGDEGRDIYLERYATWDQAFEGHKRAIEWVNEGCVEDE